MKPEPERTSYQIVDALVRRGLPRADDPDGLVLEARFFPMAEAVQVLAALPFPSMRDPLLAYLREAAGPAVWQYRREGAGRERLVARVV